MDEILRQLNSTQRQAAQHGDGPLLVVAGAGTGKTTLLISRLAYLIVEKKISTEAILLLTFTEKAAGELEERADKILPYGYIDLWINTFHGLGERILREKALDIGLNANFKLLNVTEQWALVRKNLDRFKLDYYRPLGNPTKFISELLRHFSRLKDENISPEEYWQYAEELESNQDTRLSGAPLKKGRRALKDEDDDGSEMDVLRIKELANAYHVYNQLLLENNYLDFGDLIIYVLRLFKKRPNILRQYREKFQYIMVDEFQDTNYAQYELVKLLAAPRNNLVVVGDDDQAIYKFRGASLSNIMQFKDDYPRAPELVLTDNYRSRQEILDHAYRFIQHNNPNRLEEKLKIVKQLEAKGKFDNKKGREAAVKFFNFPLAGEESSFVAKKIREIYEREVSAKKSISWADFAILVRANDTADVYIKELTRQNIPNQFMSWRGLYYKPVILDIIAYLRLLDNYHESSALFRVLNMEIFRVSHLDLVNINKMAARKAWSLYEALKNVAAIPGISQDSLKNINKLLTLINNHSLLVADHKPTKIFLRFAYDSGLLEGLDQDRDLEIYSYLNQFYQRMKKMEEAEDDIRLKDFMSALELDLEAGDTGSLKLDFVDNDAVKIMTVHGAKGLEFKYVFLVNLVDKKFPTIARGEKISIPDALVKERVADSVTGHLEEERRLFYVAVTRAKEELYLTAAQDYGGAREKKPSRFIDEMSLVNSFQADITLSEKNEFLRDVHYLSQREAESALKSSQPASYPLPDKFSFSQLAAFSTCPLQYKFAFILKVPVSTDKASLIFGRVLHNTLYNFLLPVLSQAPLAQGDLFAKLPADSAKSLTIADTFLTEKRLFELYQEFWQNDGYRDKQERDNYYQKGRQALKDFLATYLKDRPEAILFLEKKFSFRIGQDVIKGTIDRVDRRPDGSLEVIDYKTGQPKSKLDFAAKRQLILYKIFLEEFLGIKVSALSYYYLEDSSKFTFDASEKEIERLKLEVRDEIAAIKKRQFLPKPSMMCNFCDFNTICEFRQV